MSHQNLNKMCVYKMYLACDDIIHTHTQIHTQKVSTTF